MEISIEPYLLAYRRYTPVPFNQQIEIEIEFKSPQQIDSQLK